MFATADGKERKTSGGSSIRKFSLGKTDRKASGGPSSDRKGSDSKPSDGPVPMPGTLLPPTANDAEPDTFETADTFGPEFQEPEIRRLFSYIDGQRSTSVEVLREAVGIRSLSAWPEAQAEVMRMIQWTGNKLGELGLTLDVRKIGKQTTPDGVVLPLPSVLIATLGNDPEKKTILIYLHLDVTPAKPEDGWGSDPFVLTEFHGELIGRGSTDDKGPVLGWIQAIESYQKTGVPLPINIKLVLEAMEECGSEGLKELLYSETEGYLKGVELIVVSDNSWLGRTRPCLTYGLRGLCYFFVEVECGSNDLHSGVFGGVMREALPDLIYLLNSLVDAEGIIIIPGLMDDVVPVTETEEQLYESIDFDMDEFKIDSEAIELKTDKKGLMLMNRWRFPALSIHGIQGSFNDPGAKTVIPQKVIGKFSIRLVPNQTPDNVDKLVTKYVTEKWDDRRSPNKMLIYMADDGCPPWTSNPLHPSYKAGRRAVAMVYGGFPDMIREGGHMGHVLFLQEATKKKVLLLPMGACDDKVHSKNEKIDTRNYVEGTKATEENKYHRSRNSFSVTTALILFLTTLPSSAAQCFLNFGICDDPNDMQKWAFWIYDYVWHFLMLGILWAAYSNTRSITSCWLLLMNYLSTHQDRQAAAAWFVDTHGLGELDDIRLCYKLGLTYNQYLAAIDIANQRRDTTLLYKIPLVFSSLMRPTPINFLIMIGYTFLCFSFAFSFYTVYRLFRLIYGWIFY